MSALDDLAAWARYFKTRAAPVSYIVLDPMHAGDAKDEKDGLGRRYVQCSPGFLDGLKFVKHEEPLAGASLLVFDGILVYRLEDMSPDWPGLGIDHAPEVPK